MPASQRSRKRDTTLTATLDAVRKRLARNQRVRRTLPGIGRLHVDRQLPFLCVYRQPADCEDIWTDQLVKVEASYLAVTEPLASHKHVSTVVELVVETLAREFGAFLLTEVWAAPDGGEANDPAVPAVSPSFEVHAPKDSPLGPAVEAIAKRLRRIKVLKQGVKASVLRDDRTTAPGFSRLLPKRLAVAHNCWSIGLAVPPVYRRVESDEHFPLVARSLQRSVSLALRQGYFEFARSCTSHQPAHFHSLGRKAVVKAVWDVDRRLAGISDQFDYLLQLTPVNTTEAWHGFKRSRFERAPEFHYRPLPVDPAELKRQLFSIRVDRVEDPALQRIFQEKQEELELQLSMLRDRDTRRFLYQSLQLFGGVSDSLFAEAKSLLGALRPGPTPRRGGTVSAEEFAARAREHFARYREELPAFEAEAEVTDEVSGVMVSRGRLLISSGLKLPRSRVDALLAHEVGTHVVTYFNGQTQPFQQLHAGLAGYEELQEGLAVLAEYLVGGLSPGRLRQLAARVIAVRMRTEGASFVETFRALDRDYEFAQQSAYNITMRVFRGGGLTKDAVYLRGLQDLLCYLQEGGELGPLLVGKVAAEQIAIVRELQYRKVLQPPALTPLHLRGEPAASRLDAIREPGVTAANLITTRRAS